jgi:hypothetical protein
MPRRTCDSCGKTVDVSGGKVCENGHFICQTDVWSGTGGGLFGDGRKSCPLCQKPLR